MRILGNLQDLKVFWSIDRQLLGRLALIVSGGFWPCLNVCQQPVNKKVNKPKHIYDRTDQATKG